MTVCRRSGSRVGYRPHAASGREVPIGAIVGGQPYAEDRLLALAGAHQAATGWHVQRPEDPVSNSAVSSSARSRATPRARRRSARR
jgi:hypothetical protein